MAFSPKILLYPSNYAEWYIVFVFRSYVRWYFRYDKVSVNVLQRCMRDLFHVYLNRCEFHFLGMDTNKTNIFFYFLINYGRVPGMIK